MKIVWIATLFLILFPFPVSATTYLVAHDGSGDYPTIQAAIDAVVDGDIIELGDGVFTGSGNRDIDYLGKAITVRSQSGNPEACIIDCEGSQADPHRGFVFNSGEGPESVLEGLTITGGYVVYPDGGGGAVFCHSTSPEIRGCIFHNNNANTGGAVNCSFFSEPTIAGCIFSGNTATEGGAIYNFNLCAPMFEECTFTSNHADNHGGAISMRNSCAPAIASATTLKF